MRIIIIEDELPALEKLKRYLEKFPEDIEVIAESRSVEDSVKAISKVDDYDLIFMDIQLLDGLSFEIFDQVKIARPVIFTTAYDEYALDAFKVNSIDYLLKPITYTDLSRALKKYHNLKDQFNPVQFSNSIKELKNSGYKDRFIVKKGNHLHSIRTEDIAAFYADGRTIYLVDSLQKKYIIDYRLEQVIETVDPSSFYKINRGCIVNINHIRDVVIYSSSRLKVKLSVNVDKDLIVSRDKVQEFKKWYSGS
ncbi:MAG: response regulator transcription factor [Saprospiraceae bacterium]|nr:response regulator transcription factor [Saprospiraceae bacterium]